MRIASSAANGDLSRSRELWAAAAREAHELDIERARKMTPDERLAEGVDLVRIAAKLQAGQRAKFRTASA